MTNVKEVIQVNGCKEGVICENYVITQRIDGSEIIIPMIMVKGEKRRTFIASCLWDSW